MASGTTSGRFPSEIFPGLLGDRKEARAARHQTYFGGYKCLKGHLSPRMVRNAMCCKCIELEKAKEEAAYVRGLERGRAPELARKAAERAAKEKLKEEQRAARREATAKAREERARERANEKRRATLAKKKDAKVLTEQPKQEARTPENLDFSAAPWD